MKLKDKRDRQLAVLKPLGAMLDPKKCAAWLAAELHAGVSPACPVCGEIPVGSTAENLQEGRRVRCRACGKGFTIWTGTLFEGAKITPEEFVLMRLAMAAGLDFTGLIALTGRYGQCVTEWRQKIEEFNRNVIAGKHSGVRDSLADDAPLEPLPVVEIVPLNIDLDLRRLEPSADLHPFDNSDHEKDPEP